MNENILFVIFILVGLGSLVGFYSMRKSVMQIRMLAKNANKALASAETAGLSDVQFEQSEIMQLTQTFNEVTKNLESNIKRLELSKRTMQYVLSKIAAGISSLDNIDTFLDLIVEITTNALEAKFGALMLLDETGQELYINNGSGFEVDFKNIKLKVGEEAPGWVAKHKRPLFIPYIKSELESLERKDFLAPPILCAPMLYKDKLIGVLFVAGKTSEKKLDEDELLIISNLASQTAVAIENERLHVDAESAYLQTISALATAVEARDRYSRGHSDRVSQYSVKVAEKLGLAPELVKDIKDAAQLHDVGKIGIADNILNKEDLLNLEEERVMQKHSAIGECIIKPVRSLSRLCGIVKWHHEWVDGTGYPDGLKAEQIPLGAKIVGVADSFDAMTTDRPYRVALCKNDAIKEIKRLNNLQFNPRVTEAFLELCQEGKL